jgi:hypothetical protein
MTDIERKPIGRIIVVDDESFWRGEFTKEAERAGSADVEAFEDPDTAVARLRELSEKRMK